MNAEKYLRMLREVRQKEEDELIEKHGQAIENFIKKYPDGHPDKTLEDLSEYLEFIRAVNFFEKKERERKKAAETADILSVLRTLDEVENEVDNCRDI